MKFVLEIDMNGDVFDDAGELPRVLRNLAETIRANPETGSYAALDSNGNIVGQGKYVGKKN